MALACYAGLKGPLPGHVVELPTLLASGSVKPGGLGLKVKRPGALSRPGRFLHAASGSQAECVAVSMAIVKSSQSLPMWAMVLAQTFLVST